MAGQGQMPARQAAVKAGDPDDVPSTTINKVCLSGLNSIYLADQMIPAGEADIVVAGGMESHDQRPVPRCRRPRRFPLRQHRTCRRDHPATACAAPSTPCLDGARHRALRRRRHHPRRSRTSSRASRTNGRRAAIKDGLFDDEIVAVEIPQRKGDPIVVEPRRRRPGRHHDRDPRRRSSRRSTRPATSPPATPRRSPTAARPSWSCRRRAAEALGVTPLGEIVGYGRWPGPTTPPCSPAQPGHPAGARPGRHRRRRRRPVRAQRGVRRGRHGLDADLGITDEIVNVNGGAIALGHPIGMCGNRLALTMLHELAPPRRRHRRGRPVRRRRPGRRPARQDDLTSPAGSAWRPSAVGFRRAPVGGNPSSPRRVVRRGLLVIRLF